MMIVLSDESNAECDKDCSLSCRIFIQDFIIIKQID